MAEEETMKSKLINDGPQNTYVLVLDKWDDRGFCLRKRYCGRPAHRHRHLQRHGAGFFRQKIPVKEQASRGPHSSVTSHSVQTRIRALRPVVVSRADGIAMGHLPKAHVRPTLEMVLTEPPRYLRKRKESESGFALIVALTKVDPQTVATGFRASKIVGSSVVNEAN
jgi:hypothetical protein